MFRVDIIKDRVKLKKLSLYNSNSESYIFMMLKKHNFMSLLSL